MKIKTAGDLFTTSARGSLSRARLFWKRKRGVKAAISSLRKRPRISFSSGHTESSINVLLWTPYEQPEACSRTISRDLFHRHPEPNIWGW